LVVDFHHRNNHFPHNLVVIGGGGVFIASAMSLLPTPHLGRLLLFTTGEAKVMILSLVALPPTNPPAIIFHLTPNLICSPLHRHRHPSVDFCLYGGSSALMTDTPGPGVSRLLDTGHNTGSTKLGLGWERLWRL
jgi:hypothetical protein